MEPITFPIMDPFVFQLWEDGPGLRWYALAYIMGIVLGWRLVRRMGMQPPYTIRPGEMDDFVVYATLGIILGGRIGFVVFYEPEQYLENPLAILQVWQGGMAFHGGLLGVIVATVLFARARRIRVLGLGDLLACAAPIGIFFGRIANFINGELWGRETDMPWGMVFDAMHPWAGPNPRHPSQLYEAALEGVLLFAVMMWLARHRWIRRRRGTLTGVFLIGYAIGRSIAEIWRQYDPTVGLILGVFTQGQVYSVPMVFIGAGFIWHARRVAHCTRRTLPAAA